MEGGQEPAPREQGWKGLLLALAAFLLLPLPVLSALRGLLPIAETIALLVPALAVCFVVGWCVGGRVYLAILWLGLAAWGLSRPVAPGAPGAYNDLARAWALLAAGTFGVVSLISPAQRLFARALSATGLAMLIALVILTVGGRRPEQAQHVFADEFTRRAAAYTTAVQAQLRAVGTPGADGQSPALREFFEQSVQQLSEMSRLATTLAPALLALESLATFALAWALYHRLSRARLGPPLGALREFRFNDQLIWGFVAGLVIVLIPGLSPLHAAGGNLLLFFGTVYALRGFGVVAWLVSRGGGGGRVAGALAVLGVVLFWPLAMPSALGLGLSDTWLDWRRRARPAP